MDRILIYDITSLPVEEGLTFEDMLKMYKEEGVVLWSSYVVGSQKPTEPRIIGDADGIEIKDISKEENEAG